jgi:CheY-like chemotaxis protein
VNASQALPDRRGTIAFSVDRVEVKGREADRLALAPGHYARFIVRDDGVGMSDDVGTRIFEPFFTTKKVGEGTGLGLSVVDGVVRGHLGAIDVQTSPGKGSSFLVYLPADRMGALTLPSVRTTTPPVRRGEGRRLLLLDDDSAVLHTTARMLRRAGFEVDALEDAVAALAALDQPKHPYAGLITDRTMPSLSGLEVARRAHALDPLLPIILLSGAPQPGDAESPGITVVLGKPHNTRTLLDALERAQVGHSRTSGGAIA